MDFMEVQGMVEINNPYRAIDYESEASDKQDGNEEDQKSNPLAAIKVISTKGVCALMIGYALRQWEAYFLFLIIGLFHLGGGDRLVWFGARYRLDKFFTLHWRRPYQRSENGGAFAFGKLLYMNSNPVINATILLTF